MKLQASLGEELDVDNVVTRHKTEAPARRVAEGAASEEIRGPRATMRDLVLFALRTGAAFFIPLMVSVMLSYALSPAVNRLERWHIPRPFGAALVMVILIGAGTAVIHRAGAAPRG